jgi:hypothetical protein
MTFAMLLIIHKNAHNFIKYGRQPFMSGSVAELKQPFFIRISSIVKPRHQKSLTEYFT